MQIKIKYLTNGEIEFRDYLRLQQQHGEANYALALGAFLQGLADEPRREEYGVSDEAHNRILKQVA